MKEIHTKLVGQLRGFYDGQLKSLNGLLEKLPDSAKPEIEALRKNVNDQLALLVPLEQGQAVQDMSRAFESLSYLVDRISNYATEISNRLQIAQPRLQSLNSFEEQISKKELLKKSEVEEMISTSKANERKTVEGELRPQIVAVRRAMVETCGLPLPINKDGAVDEDALVSADFQQRFEGAKKNIGAAKERGFDLKAKLIERNAWLPESQFVVELNSFEELVGKPAQNSGRSHPLKGNEGKEGKQAESSRRRAVLC